MNEIISIILKLSRRNKQLVLLVSDVISLYLSIYMSFILRYDSFFILDKIINPEHFFIYFIFPFIVIPIFIKSGLYRAVLKHIGIKTIFAIVLSLSIASFISIFLIKVFSIYKTSYSIIIINLIISIFSVFVLRYVAHWFLYSFSKPKLDLVNVAIFGAGDAGVMLAESIERSHKYLLKAIIDDDITKVNTVIKSVKVYDQNQINNLIKNKDIKIILLAIPSLAKSQRKTILNRLSEFPINVMELPSIDNIIDGKVTISDIKSVEVEDILGRESAKPIDSLLNKNVKDKNILVTGAGGSIGSELCRQIYILRPKVLVLYELSEYSLYKIDYELNRMDLNVQVISILGSVQHKNKLDVLFKKYKINTVYHAAAYKHVPMVESNPCAGVYNNIIGTYHIAKQAKINGVESFVLISTDKAVRPTNIMGATKRFSELILQMFNNDNKCSTVFTMVRFGNVLDSVGSVLPLFRNQIREGGPVTVTHPDVIRYFMSIPEAVQLVIQAGAMSNGGDVFILDMGEPVNILEMAKRMIYLSGLIPSDGKNNGDISIEITGLRPGEKLYEELLIGEDSIKTEHPRIMKANEAQISNSLIEKGIVEFGEACKNQDTEKVKHLLTKYVDGYNIVEL